MTAVVGTSARTTKALLSAALGRAGLLRLGEALRGTRVVLAVNYHGTPAVLAPNLVAHFAFYRACFECIGEDTLLEFLRGSHPLERPGIVISFDDGLRDNAEVAAPLLEAHGLRGWFLVPGGFLDQHEKEQAAHFRAQIRARPDAEHPARVPQVAMTWSAVRRLSKAGHVIGCHTWSHHTLGPGVSDEIVEHEVVLAKARLEQRLGHPVRSFAWARGLAGDYSVVAQRAVRASFELGFTSMGRAIRAGDDPYVLHRFNVEASYPLAVVRFQTSIFNEAAFARRRRAVEAELQRPTATLSGRARL
jgi:peptidoglycan/xylan/chitin deacetylase (PgdA/CDA1 family)